MESKNELKETDIKKCMCYYFDDIMGDIHIYSGDSIKNHTKHTKLFLIYDISYKTFMGSIP